MNLARSLGSVGGLTLVSRVLALVRDTLQASYVGASFASDAFFVAFRLPNMFRALFAEGAFSAAFIPMFNRKVGEADERERRPALCRAGAGGAAAGPAAVHASLMLIGRLAGDLGSVGRLQEPDARAVRLRGHVCRGSPSPI